MIDIRYLSDFKEGALGCFMGLLMGGPRLPARSVILVDKGDIICYIEVVPIVSSLSDIQKH